MKKIDLKFILLHLVAIFLIIGAFENIGLIYNLDLVSSFNEFGYENGLKTYSELTNITQGEAITNLLISTQIISLLGLIIGIAASIIIARRFRISLINSGVLFVLGFWLIQFDVSNYLQFQSIFSRTDMSLITAALILTLMSFIVFFSKWTNGLIRS